jgi:hypothetical protein
MKQLEIEFSGMAGDALDLAVWAAIEKAGGEVGGAGTMLGGIAPVRGVSPVRDISAEIEDSKADALAATLRALGCEVEIIDGGDGEDA